MRATSLQENASGSSWTLAHIFIMLNLHHTSLQKNASGSSWNVHTHLHHTQYPVVVMRGASYRTWPSCAHLYVYQMAYICTRNEHWSACSHTCDFCFPPTLLTRCFSLPSTANCKINGNLQRFSTADLYHFTSGTPLERFPFILQVAVLLHSHIHSEMAYCALKSQKSNYACACTHSRWAQRDKLCFNRISR
jgi:hypothetical protein